MRVSFPGCRKKKEDFQMELDKWLEYSENQEDIKEYDFRGFIFPEIDFSRKNFIKQVDFSESQFSGDAYFNKSTFLGNAIFSMNQFKGNTSFFESKFLEDTNFNESQFSDYAIFI